MTPQEKAEDLVAAYRGTFFRNMSNSLAKQCALAAVNELLNEYPAQCPENSYEKERHLFWAEVKKEIENI